MSTTEYIIVTSTEPTYGLVSPEATVETISFGTPIGSCRIAYVASDEPPEPPRPPIASSLPSACRRLTTSAAPRAIVSTAAPRSPASARAWTSAPAAAATSSRVMSGVGERLSDDAGVDEHDVDVVLPDSIGEECVLLPLRVERAEQDHRWHRPISFHDGDTGFHAGLELLSAGSVSSTSLPSAPRTLIAPSA